MKPAPCRIAQVDRSAAEQIFALDQAIFAHGCWSKAQWQAEFSSAGVIVLLANLGNAPCGFLTAAIAGDDLEIRKIGILPPYRRNGRGRQLLQHILTLTQGAARRCLIEVSASNAEGRAFYAKSGFTEIAQRWNYYADGSAAIVMEKILSAP